MRNRETLGKKVFRVVLIKPSHYDDDGYVIRWYRSMIPSNTLAALYGLCRDLAERKVLGEGVEITISAIDETNTRVSIPDIIKEISADGGLVAFAGVQTNQFPRTMDIATVFRNEGIQVCIGGFHVSGCLAMLPELPQELQDALDMGISLFAGEAEGSLDEVFIDAYRGELKPIYNRMSTLPALESHPTPFLPAEIIHRSAASCSSFDAGRGCPFLCSFCTIINVQGRKSRFRSVDDIENIVRENAKQKIRRFLITDDNFARNKDWEKIFDRLILLREQEGLQVRLFLQVDAMCHRIPNFIEKAAQAGVIFVFIGLESINSENLLSAGKRQNKFSEYRKTLQAWQNEKIMTVVGYIAGFPADTPESIADDFRLMHQELPMDFLQLSLMTPLPGSADHKKLHEAGEWMDTDLNKYDLNHITTKHPTMSADALQRAFEDAQDFFYADEQVKTRLKRSYASGLNIHRAALGNVWYSCCRLEGVSGPDGGVFRLKDRLDRRPGMPVENPFVFYPKLMLHRIRIYSKLAFMYLKYRRMCQAILADPNAAQYTDASFSKADD